MPVKVIAFYTKDTPYEIEVENLRASLEKFNIDYHIEGVDSKGKWVLNCGIKSGFILQMLEKFEGIDLLYVDADAVVRNKLDLLDHFIGDIGVHYYKTKELLSGTIFLRNNDRVKALITRWSEEQAIQPDVWDQKIFQHVIKDDADKIGIEITELPAAYTKITDKMIGVEPIIEHNQVSRNFKDIIDEMTTIPTEVNGVRVRRAIDGSFILPRCDKESQKLLDSRYIRCKGEFRWHPKIFGGITNEEVQQIFHEQKCYIIGKGPSLDNIDASIFKEPFTPIIAINESIRAIEKLDLPNPIFAMQQDMSLRDTCLPEKGNLIIAHSVSSWYPNTNRKYMYHPAEYGGPNLTVIHAIKMIKSFGVKYITFISFDACVNEDTGYAKIVGYEPTKGGNPRRFLNHRQKIEAVTTDCFISWITPGVHD